MAHRRRSFAGPDHDWDSGGDVALEVIDVALPGGVAPAGPLPTEDRRTRRRSRWLAALAFTGLTAVAGYAFVNHRAAVAITNGWTQATAEAGALSTVMEGLRTSAMLADVTGEDPEAFVEVRQATVREMRALLRTRRDDVAGAVPIDPRLVALRFDALEQLDAWAAEMDAFIDRRGLWLRTPEFQRIDPRIEQAAQRWRVDLAPPRPPADLTGAAFLARLERPTDEPLPIIVTAITSSGDRLDIDLARGRTTRTELDDDHVALGATSYAMVVEDGAISVLHDGRRLARMPLDPSPDLEPVDELQAALPPNAHVPDRVPLAIDPADGRIVATSSASGWTVVGIRRDPRLSLRAVEDATGRVVVIRLPDPYVSAFVARPAA